MKLRLLMTILLAFVLSIGAYAQEFSSKKLLDRSTYEVEIIFHEISSLDKAENIIKQVGLIEGVKEIELFYPTTNNAKIIVDEKVFKIHDLIAELASIGVQLNQKSFREE